MNSDDPGSQIQVRTGKPFLKNHASDFWPVIFFLLVKFSFVNFMPFFLNEYSSRRIVHFGVTRHPTDEWVAHQLREAIPCELRPK